MGVSSAAVDLASLLGTRLTRGDYRNLLGAGLCKIEVLEKATDDEILSCLGTTPRSAEKLAELREAVQQFHERKAESSVSWPILPPYEG